LDSITVAAVVGVFAEYCDPALDLGTYRGEEPPAVIVGGSMHAPRPPLTRHTRPCRVGRLVASTGRARRSRESGNGGALGIGDCTIRAHRQGDAVSNLSGCSSRAGQCEARRWAHAIASVRRRTRECAFTRARAHTRTRDTKSMHTCRLARLFFFFFSAVYTH
jgi:hypothetical protein